MEERQLHELRQKEIKRRAIRQRDIMNQHQIYKGIRKDMPKPTKLIPSEKTDHRRNRKDIKENLRDLKNRWQEFDDYSEEFD